MPEQPTIGRAKRQQRAGKRPTTQAGEFVREEIHHIRKGKHGARSTKQAIAIGLSKARRAGVKLPPRKKGHVSERTRRHAERALQAGRKRQKRSVALQRSRATMQALKREKRSAASPKALSEQARQTARRRAA